MCCLMIRQKRPENKKIRKKKARLSSWIKTTLASELVISGEVYIKAIMNDNTSWTFGEESTPVLRYWPIKIGIDGLDSEDTYYGQVHRNVVYNISATIAGNGYADPTLP